MLSSSTEGGQLFFFELKSVLKGLKMQLSLQLPNYYPSTCVCASHLAGNSRLRVVSPKSIPLGIRADTVKND